MLALRYLLLLTALVEGRLLGKRDEPTIQDLRKHRKLIFPLFGRPIEDSYIVVVKNEADDLPFKRVRNILKNAGVAFAYEYNGGVKGFAVRGLVTRFLAFLLDDDDIEYVEQDQLIIEDDLPHRKVAEDKLMMVQSQSRPVNWALDRIDQKSLPLNDKYEYTLTGKGVSIYVLDSGINFEHNEFSGRSVRCGFSAIRSEGCEDGRGHGSHVSGTAAGTNFGVAKEADLVAVKVLGSDGTGTFSGVVAAVNFVEDEKKKYPNRPMVANMSLGGPMSTTINRAVAAAVSLGVTFVVSAGNDGFDACRKSPASSASAITIAASNFDDEQEYYSNYGECVDLFAPGSEIVSAWKGGVAAVKTESGTSMATPLATGVAALYLERDPNLTPAQVKATMMADSVPGAVASPNDDTPSNLLSTYKFALEFDEGTTSQAPTSTMNNEESAYSDMPSDTPTLSPMPSTKPVSLAPVDSAITPPNLQRCTTIFGSCSYLRDPVCCSRTCWVGTCMPLYID